MEHSYQTQYDLILQECRTALYSISPESLDAMLHQVTQANRVFFIGVGRVLLSLEAMAKRWAHCGVDTVVVGQITEPAITPNDVLLVASGSGESLIPVAISQKAKKLGAKVILIGSNPESTIQRLADVFVRIPVRTKLARPDEIDSQQPMTSLFEQTLLLLGDTIAAELIRRQKLDLHTLWQYHANLE